MPRRIGYRNPSSLFVLSSPNIDKSISYHCRISWEFWISGTRIGRICHNTNLELYDISRFETTFETRDPIFTTKTTTPFKIWKTEKTISSCHATMSRKTITNCLLNNARGTRRSEKGKPKCHLYRNVTLSAKSTFDLVLLWNLDTDCTTFCCVQVQTHL